MITVTAKIIMLISITIIMITMIIMKSKGESSPT